MKSLQGIKMLNFSSERVKNEQISRNFTEREEWC